VIGEKIGNWKRGVTSWSVPAAHQGYDADGKGTFQHADEETECEDLFG
jgi:hypothetical protein